MSKVSFEPGAKTVTEALLQTIALALFMNMIFFLLQVNDILHLYCSLVIMFVN